MSQRLSEKARKKRRAYNTNYQKQYVKRYVFKLNSKHDNELIQMLEQIDNKNAWFKAKLEEAAR
ncbi:MAG: hypothetical protein IKD66_03920 [Solobacterium sp.]|nr:hypothetical protein [Solobacterium sp.]